LQEVVILLHKIVRNDFQTALADRKVVKNRTLWIKFIT